MALATEERKTKGRENRQQIAEVQKQKEAGEFKLPHYSELPSTRPRMPRTQREMQLHLSGRHEHIFRGPINRKERREWNKYWTLKGRGFTKPMKKGERF